MKQLFHQPAAYVFDYRTLGLFFGLYFFLACLTYGIAVPSGPV
jgi:hypothetical protein